MRSHKSHYIHGSEPDEQRRLALLNDLLNRRSLTALGLAAGERVLDVGSGLGQLSRAIAREVGPRGIVVGVERDPSQLAEAKRLAREAGEDGLVEFRLGDASDLPLNDEEWQSFDVAHARFILEHVPQPQAVVRAMVRAAAVGGRVVLEDDDHDLLRLWPEVPQFGALWDAYLKSYDLVGNDPYIGRRLAAMLDAAGAPPVRNAMPFFGGCAGEESFEGLVTNFLGLIEGAREQILVGSSLSKEELESGLVAFREWALQPGAALWYVTCWAEGRRSALETDTGEDQETLRVVRPRSKVASMQLLVESGADLNSSLHLEDVFQKIAERIQRVIDCHLFCVMLWNENAQLLEHSYSLRFGEHIHEEGGFPLGYGLSGTAALDRQAIRVPDVLEDPRYIRFRHAEVEIRSELAVPLVVKGQLIGVIDLESQQLGAFSEEHEQIVSALASQIATALENARLYEELRAKEERLKEDLATAREIQRGLLPGRPRGVPGLEVGTAFTAARELSGDFYDFLRYPDGRIAIVLGDVAGKSTAAALYGSLAVGLTRGYALEQKYDPAGLLERLNEQLLTLEIRRRFAAMLFALFEPKTKTLSIAAAGIPRPYHVQGGEVIEVEVSGMPVGALPTVRYEARELTLLSGDVVLFCSDGLEDCVNESGERLGDTRLQRFLARSSGEPAQSMADSLMELSESHAGRNAEISDDRTVVVLKVS